MMILIGECETNLNTEHSRTTRILVVVLAHDIICSRKAVCRDGILRGRGKKKKDTEENGKGINR